MIRVYLDWNIFSYLKHFKEIKEPYISLNRNLLKYSDKLLIPFTSAHLTDLVTSYNGSEKGKFETEKDLEYLEHLTHNLCILYNKNHKIFPDTRNIQECFKQILKDNSPPSEEDDLISPFEEYSDDPLVKPHIDKLKSMPAMDFSFLENMPKKYKEFKNIYANTIRNKTYYDFFNDSYKLISAFEKNPIIYKSIRNSTLEDLKISNDYSKSENPIEDISKKLEKSSFKQSFKEFVESGVKTRFKGKQPSGFEAFVDYYMHLDYLGYYRDKHFKNLIQDAFHAYYGAHCDFFVTDDNNTYHKAKAIYTFFNIETIVCKSSAFNSDFYGKVLLKKEFETSLLKSISKIIKSSFVISNQHDDKFNPADIYKMDHYVLNHFNRVQITHNINGRQILYIYKNSKNLSDFLFFKEIESVTNSLVKEFGHDINFHVEYNPVIENKEVADGSWKGRAWKAENALIELQIKEFPFLLTLSIDL